MSSEVTRQTGPTEFHELPFERSPQKLKTFLQFLSTTLDTANTDRLKLAHRQWKELKESDVQMPEIINTVFSSYDETDQTLDAFIKECENEAFHIKQICEKYIKSISLN